jgi:hypothetical protein
VLHVVCEFNETAEPTSPQRVKRRHCKAIGACPLYLPKADIGDRCSHVCFGPILLKKSAVALGEIR